MKIQGQYVTSCAEFTEIEVDYHTLAKQLSYIETMCLIDTLEMFKVAYEWQCLTHKPKEYNNIDELEATGQLLTFDTAIINKINEIISHINKRE